jgi:hypothetical protein
MDLLQVRCPEVPLDSRVEFRLAQQSSPSQAMSSQVGWRAVRDGSPSEHLQVVREFISAKLRKHNSHYADLRRWLIGFAAPLTGHSFKCCSVKKG